MKKVFDFIWSDWKRYLDLHATMNPLLAAVVFFHNPGMFFSILYRIEHSLWSSQNIAAKGLGVLMYPLYFLMTYHVLDIDIPPSVRIGRGLYIHNKGIIFANTIRAGDNLTLIGPITCGVKEFTGSGASPRFGNNVHIYTGARVIGNISIGNHVVIGANAVVLTNIPSHRMAVGIPAKARKMT